MTDYSRQTSMETVEEAVEWIVLNNSNFYGDMRFVFFQSENYIDPVISDFTRLSSATLFVLLTLNGTQMSLLAVFSTPASWAASANPTSQRFQERSGSTWLYPDTYYRDTYS